MRRSRMSVCVLLLRILLTAAHASASGTGAADLERSFGTRSPWRITVTQGPPVDGPGSMEDGKEPGVVTICLRKAAGGPCDSALREKLTTGSAGDDFAMPHYLEQTQVVHPHGQSGKPLLLVQTSSLHAGDGDQVRLLQALSYDAAADRFVRTFEYSESTNNNQEIRYLESGPLQGDIVSVDPTQDAPFGFWVIVNSPGADNSYRVVLRYRSATRYADGNPLAVIDSEMPEIQRRLGAWRTGPTPLPKTSCPKPHLVRMELWCQ